MLDHLVQQQGKDNCQLQYKANPHFRFLSEALELNTKLKLIPNEGTLRLIWYQTINKDKS
jgi:hypothetical protein